MKNLIMGPRGLRPLGINPLRTSLFGDDWRNDFDLMNQNMNRMLEGVGDFLDFTPTLSSRNVSYSPPSVLRALDTHYLFSMDLPGVNKEDIAIDCHDGILHVSGERRSDDEAETGQYRYRETQFGSFDQSFRLPVDSKDSDIEAYFENGVLRVAIPRVEAKKPKKIPLVGTKPKLFERLLNATRRESKNEGKGTVKVA